MTFRATGPNAAEACFTSDHERLFKEIWSRIATAGAPEMVLAAARGELQHLLRRESDGPARERALALIDAYFASIAAIPPQDAAQSLKSFIEVVTRIVIVERPARQSGMEGGPTLVSTLDRARDFVLARPAAPTEIHVVPCPPVQCHGDFPTLLAEGILYRLRVVLRFFQRSNPAVKRRRQAPFLFCPDFAVRLEQVVERHILPQILNCKLVDYIAAGRDWSAVTTAQLWPVLERDKRASQIYELWKTAWQGLHRRKILRNEGGEGKEVWQCRPAYRQVRALLTCDSYELPAFDNDFLDFLASLLIDYSAESLEAAWARLRQFYEQELDQRVYQDRARDGALRDSLLDCFARYPDRFSEMVVLLCYYCFPRLSMRFLITFTRSRGRTQEERSARIPLLTAFLEEEGTAEIVAEEDAAEQARLRALADQYAHYRLAAGGSKLPRTAMNWQIANRPARRRQN